MADYASAAAKRVYHVARLDAQGDAKFAFNLRRRDDGGIGLSAIRDRGLTDEEQKSLFRHFGARLVARTGGTDGGKSWEGTVEHAPGTEAHFLAAVHALPGPFCLVSSEE